MDDRDLTSYQKTLTESLDRVTKSRNGSPAGTLSREYYEGQVTGFLLALSYLHIWSRGRYGSAIPDQSAQDATPPVIETT